MPLEVWIGRDEDNDYKLMVHIGSDDSSGYKKYVKDLNEAAEVVKDYIKDNFEDDGADICWRVQKVKKVLCFLYFNNAENIL